MTSTDSRSAVVAIRPAPAQRRLALRRLALRRRPGRAGAAACGG